MGASEGGGVECRGDKEITRGSRRESWYGGDHARAGTLIGKRFSFKERGVKSD